MKKELIAICNNNGNDKGRSNTSNMLVMVFRNILKKMTERFFSLRCSVGRIMLMNNAYEMTII